MAFPVTNGYPSMTGVYASEIYSAKLRVKFYANTFLSQISNTDYEGEIKKQGDKVIIRTIPDITINDHAIGQDLVYETPEGSIVELLIDKGKSWSFAVDMIQQKQSDIDYVNKWSDDASMQMKISIERSLLQGIYNDAATANKGTTAGAISGEIDMGSTGSPITLSKSNVLEKIVDMGSVLDEQNVPDTDRFLVLPVWVCNLLKKSDLKDASLTGDNQSVLRNGRIGMIDNMTIYKSNLVYNPTGQEYYYIMGGHKSALTFASQITANEMVDNPKTFGKLVRGLQVYGYKTIKSEALVTMVAQN